MCKHSKLHFLFPSESFERKFCQTVYDLTGRSKANNHLCFYDDTLRWSLDGVAISTMRGNPDKGINLNPVHIRVNSIPTLETVCNCQLHMGTN